MRIKAPLALLLIGTLSWAAPHSTASSDILQTARAGLFASNDVDAARASARAALQQNAADPEALFLEMEGAALQADTAAELDAALQLLERSPKDRRAGIAASRVLDLANNSSAFRAVLPRIQQLIADHVPQSNSLRAALLAAAADGAPGIPMLQTARESGLVTDWRVAGPFGRYPNLDFDRSFDPESIGLGLPVVAGHAVEALQFADGNFILPDYFGHEGVLYAGADTDVARSGNFYVRIESSGTMEVFVDGTSVVRKDDRFRASPEVAWSKVHLVAGTHHVLVKFLASAAPFRVAVLPAQAGGSRRGEQAISDADEAEYIAAEEKFWSGDFSGALGGLQSLTRHSAAAAFLDARTWAHLDDDSAEEINSLRAALRMAPSAAAAEFDLAERAFGSGRTDDALRGLRHALQERPNFAPGQRLMAEIAEKMNWNSDAESAYDAQIRLHPSCSVLQAADKFFSAHDKFAPAGEVEQQLQECAPQSLAYVSTLAHAGRHQDASQAAAEIVAVHPLNRTAQEMLVRELALSGDAAAAQRAAQKLAALAPNSERYTRLASSQDPAALLEDGSAGDFADPNPFYSRWRRDGVQMVAQTLQRKFSGGPAVTLLDDRVARVDASGAISLYVHTVTRVLNRDGIERYGEVEIPRGADLLQLRTIKPDGSIAEPELTPNKATVSMPGLAPQDAIDEEYVAHLDGGIAAHPEVFCHTFGSFKAPILYSRFVVIPAVPVQIENHGDVPAGSQETTEDGRALVWEKNDIAQSVSEVALPEAAVQPTVEVLPSLERGWAEVRDQYRDQMIDAVREGSRVEQTARQVTRLASNADAEAMARGLYHWVVDNVRADDDAWTPGEIPSAEDTLGSGTGSRTVTLLALARAAGLSADLLLARNPGTDQPRVPAWNAYTRPLALFHLPSRDIAVDAEIDGLAFGALSPGVERSDALLVPLASEHASAVEIAEMQRPVIVGVLGPAAVSEQSVASADVRLDRNGDLDADVHIVLGSWRASQMRSLLAATAPGQRGDFFLQMAARIFSGATQASGTVRYEGDPDHALEIDLHCRAPQFVNLSGQTADLDQFVPSLGLKKMYATGSQRQFPLFVDTPLVETSTFRVHLPAGVQVLRLAPDAQVRSDFGRYSLTFRQVQNGVVEIRRDFRIPVQLVPSNKLATFRGFAAQIDYAERQRMTVENLTATASAGVPSSSPQQ